MEIGTLYDYDQDVIKRYSGYICHAPARKIPRLTAFLTPFPTESPLLGSPYLSEGYELC